MRFSKIQDGRRHAAAILDFFENFKIAAYSPCWSEAAHQFSKRSVKGFKSYEIFKNPRWPPACGRHLGFFLKILELQVIALVGLKWPTKFQKDRQHGLKLCDFQKSKMAAGMRPPSWIF
jgi:hypothetical protein